MRHVSDRVAVMYLGRIVEEAETDATIERPQHPYTRFLLDTVPNIERPNRNRASAAVDLPNPIDPPPGCAYNPRCPLASDICRREAPETRIVGDSLVRCHNAAADGEAAMT